ncbi:hypothetical protein Tco_1180003 [Tanacetum coccineum]
MAATIKHMSANFSKLDKFEAMDFRRWQKKMNFFFKSMSVVYMFSTLIPDDGGDDATVKHIGKRSKWENDDYVCRGLILNGMSDTLFDIYQFHGSAKELYDFLESKYMTKDAFSKKFFKDCKHTLKHKKEELTLVKLGSHLLIEESLRAHEIEKLKSNNIVGSSVVNMVEHKTLPSTTTTKANDDDVAWWVDSSATIHGCRAVVRLSNPKMKTLSDRVIMEYLVNISKRRAFWSLNEDILKISCSENQYTVSIKEDTAYLFLYSLKTTKET